MKKQDVKQIVDDFVELDKDFYYDMLEYFLKIGYLTHNEVDTIYDEENDEYIDITNKEDYEPFLINDNFKDENIIQLYKLFNKRLKDNFTLVDKLNNLQSKNDRNQELIEVQKQMMKIQVKKIITTTEFEEIYSISKNSQRNLRSRLYNPLPFRQRVDEKTNKPIRGGKITYYQEDVEKWFENNYNR